MKSILYFTAFLLVFSCTKNKDNGPDTGCAKIVSSNPNEKVLPDQELNSIHTLFVKNDLSSTNLQFIYYFNDSTTGLKVVTGVQYVNDLKVFTNNLVYTFNGNDSLISMNKNDIVQDLSLSATPKLSTKKVREVFLDEVSKDIFENKDSTIGENCVDMEFGYYDINRVTNDTTFNYTTAWKAYPQDRKFPYAFINDQNSDLLEYNNGIVFTSNEASR